MIATANLALRFVLELAGLAALAYAGFQALEGPGRWLAALGAPVALGLLWAFVVAPNATNPLAPSLREIVGSVALLCTAAALALTGHPRLGLVFGVLGVANHVLFAVLRDAATCPELAR